MDYFAGLDISMDETHVCVLDREGVVIHESKTASTAQSIADELAKAPSCRRIVFETGRMAPILFHGLSQLGLPVVCVESRQAYQALKSLATHKTDRCPFLAAKNGCGRLPTPAGVGSRSAKTAVSSLLQCRNRHDGTALHNAPQARIDRPVDKRRASHPLPQAAFKLTSFLRHPGFAQALNHPVPEVEHAWIGVRREVLSPPRIPCRDRFCPAEGRAR
jgi:hypothetical protein